jgi:butyrate kinase
MLSEKKLEHSDEEVRSWAQHQHVERRKELILEWLSSIGASMADIDVISMRVAILPKPVAGGIFLVDGAIRNDIQSKYEPEKKLSHGSRILMPLVDGLCAGRSIPCYIVEPASQNNLIPEAKISGHPMIERDTIFQALNHKMVAHLQAEKLGKKYEDCNFVVAHMGGGISVGAHQRGRIIDVNNCLGQEGAFSPTRGGTVPARKLIDLCYSGKLTHDEALKLTHPEGGVLAYLGTSDMREVEKRASEGDEKADLIFRTMAYRTAKEIGAMCAVIEGEIDGIILTGGIANSKRMVQLISDRVKRFAPFFLYPGEKESEALISGVMRILNGEEELAVYPA